MFSRDLNPGPAGRVAEGDPHPRRQSLVRLSLRQCKRTQSSRRATTATSSAQEHALTVRAASLEESSGTGRVTGPVSPATGAASTWSPCGCDGSLAAKGASVRSSTCAVALSGLRREEARCAAIALDMALQSNHQTEVARG